MKQNKKKNKDTILVTLVVKSLYTNIPYHVGIKTVKSALNFVSQKPIAMEVVIRLLFLILTLNNLVFNGIPICKKEDVLWEQYAH